MNNLSNTFGKIIFELFFCFRLVDPCKSSSVIQGDQKVSVHLMITVQKKKNKQKYFEQFQSLTMAITEYIRNVDRAILNTVFENTVRRVNKCLETGGGHFEHYL
jgi:hypothetical protein